jgi:YD repeat-containing protein
MKIPPIAHRRSRNGFVSAARRIVIKANNALQRICSLFLIAAMLIPVFFAGPVERAKASVRQSVAAAPVSAPPEPFVVGKVAKALAPATIAVNVLTALMAMLPSNEMPEGIVVPNPPTLSQRVYSTFGSVLAFVAPSAKAAKPLAPPPPTSNAVEFDFDGDGKADVGRWHATNTEFKVKHSSTGSYPTPTTIGASASKPAPGDFDGDGKFDAAVFNAGTWNIKNSSNGDTSSFLWGTTGDIPVPGFYDTDTISDFAIWRPSTATWWILSSLSGGYSGTQYGLSTDIPVPGDFNGDGKTDLAVWRTGYWHVQYTGGGGFSLPWGSAGDTPLIGDFDGDGKEDPAVFRPSTGIWYVLSSLSNYTTYTANTWGNYGDQPVPADYDNDGKGDHAIWRPTTGEWYIAKSGGGYDIHALGVPGDIAIPSSFTKQVGGTATTDEKAQARLSPRNATGGTNLYSQNFGWGTTLVSLPGRSGLDASLGIGYNSLIWTKVGSEMHFDTNNSNAGPGFTFGLPVIEPIYWNATTSKWSYIMVSASGAHTEFRQTKASNKYETADSSYTQLVTSTSQSANDPVEEVDLTVKTTDGTQMTYDWIMGGYRCTQIKDRNGNFITATYHWTGDLDKLTDTLGRVITVNYDSGTGHPTTIQQTWAESNGAGPGTTTHTWATLSYTTKTVDTDFGSAITGIIGPPDTTSVTVLDKITYADGSSNKFSYNNYLQVWKVQNYAADNHELNYVRTNLQSPGTQQPDCPRFTEVASYVENFNNGAEVIVNNSLTANQPYSLPHVSGSATRIQVWTSGHPDNLRSNIFVSPSGWQEGLPIVTEDCLTTSASDCPTRKRWTWASWTQDDAGASYLTNPRIIESRVGDGTNVKRSTLEYYPVTTGSPVALYGLVKNTSVYDVDLTTVLKQSYVQYLLDSPYISRRIIGLPSEVQTFGRNESAVLVQSSRSTYVYDQGDFNDSTLSQSIAPVQHDPAYDANFITGRGNLTSATRHDVNGQLAATTSSVKYNTAGSIVLQSDPLGRSTQFVYLDDEMFNDGISRNTSAYPTKIKEVANTGDPTNNSSSAKYRYDIGASVWTSAPKPYGNNFGQQGAVLFDDLGRVQKESILKDGQEYAYVRYEHFDNGKQAKSFSTFVDTNGNGIGDSSDEVQTETWFDGFGRVRRSRTEHPTSQNGWSGVLTEYDVLGRTKRSTVPTEISVTGEVWTPAGDDNRGLDQQNQPLWLWSTQEYDWQGRVTRSTNTDGTYSEAIYEGCGCAGGETVTIKGEEILEAVAGGGQQSLGRRTKKIWKDPLGREYKTDIFAWDGISVYSSSVSKLNQYDKPYWTKEYDGPGYPSNPRYQQTTFTYDGFSRLSSKHIPQQSGGSTSFTYNGDDSVNTITDARSAVTAYTYNTRGLLEQINWSVPTGSAVQVPGTVAFHYDSAGNRRLMADQVGVTTYNYDSLSRITSESRQFYNVGTDLQQAPGGYATFNLSYEYEPSGDLRSITDPYGQATYYTNNRKGETTAISGSWFAGGYHSYLNNVKYRAWGAVSSIGYLNSAGTTTETITYNSGLLPNNYSLYHAANGVTSIRKQYQYYGDGELKYIKDGDPNGSGTVFDRSYKFDNVGRTYDARTGSEARGGAVPAADQRPYAYRWQHDVWGNAISSTLDQWSIEAPTVLKSYVNNRITDTGHTYDNDGRLTEIDGMKYTFDAVGDLRSIENPNNYIQNRWADGEGRLVREHFTQWVVDGGHPNGHYVPMAEVKYSIRSSVLGGDVIAEAIRDGRKDTTYVYGLGRTVGKQKSQHLPGYIPQVISWDYSDASATSIQTTNSLQTYPFPAATSELDPLNNDVRTGPPGPGSGGGPEPWNYPQHGSNYDGGYCTVDGVEMSCSIVMGMLANGSAVQCPDNQCGPVYNPRDINGDGGIDTYWDRYQGFADGSEGWGPAVGAVYRGDGRFELPGNGREEPPTLRAGGGGGIPTTWGSATGSDPEGDDGLQQDDELEALLRQMAGSWGPEANDGLGDFLLDLAARPTTCGVNPVTGKPGIPFKPIRGPFDHSRPGTFGTLRKGIGGAGGFRERTGGRHDAADIVSPVGTPSVANRGGVVVAVQRGHNGGYGNTVIIEHAGQNSTYYTQYSHLSAISVGLGPISQGAVVGRSGRTGNPPKNQLASEDHLHFGFFSGPVNGNSRPQRQNWQDPVKYLNNPCP